MLLKAIVRGSPHAIVPISWTNRKTVIVLYIWIEKMLSRGDVRRPSPPP